LEKPEKRKGKAMITKRTRQSVELIMGTVSTQLVETPEKRKNFQKEE